MHQREFLKWSSIVYGGSCSCVGGVDLLLLFCMTYTSSCVGGVDLLLLFCVAHTGQLFDLGSD